MREAVLVVPQTVLELRGSLEFVKKNFLHSRTLIFCDLVKSNVFSSFLKYWHPPTVKITFVSKPMWPRR